MHSVSAAHGRSTHSFVVVGIEHLDGSNIMAEFPDGSFKDYDAASVKAARGVCPAAGLHHFLPLGLFA